MVQDWFGLERIKPSTPDYYHDLDVEQNASKRDIKRAYNQLALLHHPGKGGDPAEFRKICEAYTFLYNNSKRKQYDESYVEHQKWQQAMTSHRGCKGSAQKRGAVSTQSQQPVHSTEGSETAQARPGDSPECASGAGAEEEQEEELHGGKEVQEAEEFLLNFEQKYPRPVDEPSTPANDDLSEEELREAIQREWGSAMEVYLAMMARQNRPCVCECVCQGKAKAESQCSCPDWISSATTMSVS